jgi:ribosome-associated translation inhibitor RaiA
MCSNAMNIKIVPVNIKLLDQQKEYLEKRIKNLEKVGQRYGERSLLTITMGKVTSNQETGEIFFAEANFAIPGKDIICKVQGNNIEETMDRLCDKLKSLMIKNKELRKGRFRRLARALKDKLHF